MALSVEPEDVEFQTKLDEKSLIKAKEELGEVEKDRITAVQSFRNLILQEKWLRTPTEFSFLLRFLRARKHSQLLAIETLENYWTSKTKTPEWFANLDPADPKLQELMRFGFYYAPKKLDSQGRRVLIEQPGMLDLDAIQKEYSVDMVFRTIVLICEWLNRDEHVQVNGLVVFLDCTNLTMRHHLQLFGVENTGKLMHFYQNSLPARIKGMHFYKEPAFFDVIWELLKTLMREKTRSRISLHGNNMAHVYERVDMSVLPDEYLPDDYIGPSAGPAKQIVEEMIEDMMKPDFRDYIKDLSSDRYGVDLEKKKQSMPTVASFRKVNPD